MSDVVVETAVAALASGKAIVVIDDVAVAPAAFVLFAASHVTEQNISFMVNEARGVVCAAISQERADTLSLPMMAAPDSEYPFDCTVSVEARHGVSTGISAADRAQTLRVLAHSQSPKRDIVTPGHILPVRAKRGGVLVRASVWEAAIDLLQLAKLPEVAVVVHCLNDSGDLATPGEAATLAGTHGIAALELSDIIAYRLQRQTIVTPVATALLPTLTAGKFMASVFRSTIDDAEHLALVRGSVGDQSIDDKKPPVLVRVQAENRIGDLLIARPFYSQRHIAACLQAIDKADRGVFVYVRHPRKGILAQQVRECSSETPSQSKASQLRELGVGAQILLSLGVKRIALLTNSLRELRAVESFGLEIVERVRYES